MNIYNSLSNKWLQVKSFADFVKFTRYIVTLGYYEFRRTEINLEAGRKVFSERAVQNGKPASQRVVLGVGGGAVAFCVGYLLETNLSLAQQGIKYLVESVPASEVIDSDTLAIIVENTPWGVALLLGFGTAVYAYKKGWVAQETKDKEEVKEEVVGFGEVQKEKIPSTIQTEVRTNEVDDKTEDSGQKIKDTEGNENNHAGFVEEEITITVEPPKRKKNGEFNLINNDEEVIDITNQKKGSVQNLRDLFEKKGKGEEQPIASQGNQKLQKNSTVRNNKDISNTGRNSTPTIEKQTNVQILEVPKEVKKVLEQNQDKTNIARSSYEEKPIIVLKEEKEKKEEPSNLNLIIETTETIIKVGNEKKSENQDLIDTDAQKYKVSEFSEESKNKKVLNELTENDDKIGEESPKEDWKSPFPAELPKFTAQVVTEEQNENKESIDTDSSTDERPGSNEETNQNYETPYDDPISELEFIVESSSQKEKNEQTIYCPAPTHTPSICPVNDGNANLSTSLKDWIGGYKNEVQAIQAQLEKGGAKGQERYWENMVLGLLFNRNTTIKNSREILKDFVKNDLISKELDQALRNLMDAISPDDNSNKKLKTSKKPKGNELKKSDSKEKTKKLKENPKKEKGEKKENKKVNKDKKESSGDKIKKTAQNIIKK